MQISLPGIWGDMERRWTAVGIAQVLDITLTEVERLAWNSARPKVGQAELLEDLCLLHGIVPRLYHYQDWKDPKGVCIASEPRGWIVWTHQNGYIKNTIWIGNPICLRLATPPEFIYARDRGWPYPEPEK